MEHSFKVKMVDGSIELLTIPQISEQKRRIIEILEFLTEPDNLDYVFRDCTNLTKISAKIPDTVTSMNGTFSYCCNLNQPIELPKSLESANECFKGCTCLNSQITIPIGLIEAESMFEDCHEYNQPTTFYHVENLISCFRCCTDLNSSIDLGDKAKYIQYIFSGCYKFNQPLEIPYSVVKCHTMLSSCKKFNNTIKISIQTSEDILKYTDMLFLLPKKNTPTVNIDFTADTGFTNRLALELDAPEGTKFN